MTSKTGPIGPALLSAVKELDLITPSQETSIRLLGGHELALAIDDLRQAIDPETSEKISDVWNRMVEHKELQTFKRKQRRHLRFAELVKSKYPNVSPLRRIAYFADKEGKTRVIAIGDYWSQACLKPYHEALGEILRSLPGDCTFNQGAFMTRLTKGPFYSFDLSNATDRMPLILQRRIFSHIFGEEKANAWVELLVGSEYITPLGTGAAYLAGQPMGMYSS